MRRTSPRRPLAPTAALAAASLLAVLGGGCDEGRGSNGPNSAIGERRAMLTNLGEGVILATYRDFDVAARALRDAAAAWSASQAPAERAAAQQAWLDAMALWQQAEVFQIGPAGVMGEVAGGQDLRDAIYSWPLVNPCRVDQELAESTFDDLDALAAEPVNVRGLDALEYLLFYDGSTNACAPNALLNTSGAWAALDAAELERRRAAYATAAAELVVVASADLVARWEPQGGNFLEQLASAHDGSSVYPGTQAALNALSDAMYYLETETKDMKLAEPAGIMNCLTESCPQALESQWAHASKSHVRNNLVAFQRLFLGGTPGSDGEGFDDLLRDLGQAELADTMAAELTEALAAIDAVEGSFVDVLAANPRGLDAAFDEVKNVTDLLKTQLIGVLNLEPPARAETDND